MFYTASTEGLPLMRPMWQEFPQDENTFAMETQFMFGDALLVAPKLDSY
jgi:alpha-glucosidase (family GH31 glycosyl hydrolase)